MNSIMNNCYKYGRDNCLYFLLLLPFLEPQLFKTAGYEFIDQLYAAFKMISVILIAFIYIYKFEVKISFCLAIMIVLQAIIMISTIVNNGSLVRFAGPAITSIVMLMIGELINKGKWTQFMYMLRSLLLILVIINITEQIFRVFF